ncbi:MAG TPA: response regulator [Spirochaetota bacterium]|nr:response regulator [Spirochaetota bacterium]HPI24009.1 response regulator [Spirochaetota bacterium]HPU88678.1 response regulator [Spirochaetota bacterium]
MEEKILIIDDDENLLSSFKRSLGRDFTIETAAGGEAGVAAMAKNGPFAVIMSDLKMPGMDGIQVLARARELAPKSVRIMLTGNADLAIAIDAINRGNIFRFLTKPCPPEELAAVLAAATEQYRLVMAEKELLEKTLSGSIKVLTDVLSLVNPRAFSHASRVRRLVRQLASAMNFARTWELEISAMLSQVGCVTIPEDILDKVFALKPLTPPELAMYQNYPKAGSDIIANIPRMARVADIIRNQESHFDNSKPAVGGPAGTKIPPESYILKTALDYDLYIGAGMAADAALIEMHKHASRYDPAIIKALEMVITGEDKFEIRQVGIDQLTCKMILAEDVIANNGKLIVSKGEEVTASMKMRLVNFNKSMGLRDTFRVIVVKD